MNSQSFMEGRSFTGAAAAYREVARRDPRKYGCGYLAADPATGSPGAFLWFASPAEMFAFLCSVEVALLQFDDDESERIESNLRRAIGRTRDPARIDRDALSAAFEGWCEILWLGTFAELCEKGGTFATSVRAHFRAQHRLGEHAGPIAPDEVERFIDQIRALLPSEDATAEA